MRTSAWVGFAGNTAILWGGVGLGMGETKGWPVMLAGSVLVMFGVILSIAARGFAQEEVRHAR